MMSQRHKLRSDSIRNTQKELPPNLPRPLLKICTGTKPRSPFNEEFDIEPRTELPHKLLIAVRLGAANPMVQMRRRNFEPQPRTQLEQRRDERDRIRATRKSNE